MPKELVEEATSIILSQDLIQVCFAHFDLDNLDIDGYMKEVNALLEPTSSISPWTMKYE